jgi:hypothetical protein
VPVEIQHRPAGHHFATRTNRSFVHPTFSAGQKRTRPPTSWPCAGLDQTDIH